MVMGQEGEQIRLRKGHLWRWQHLLNVHPFPGLIHFHCSTWTCTNNIAGVSLTGLAGTFLVVRGLLMLDCYFTGQGVVVDWAKWGEWENYSQIVQNPVRGISFRALKIESNVDFLSL